MLSSVLCLGEGSHESFLQTEFDGLKLGDARLQPRTLKIFKGPLTNFTSCVKNLFCKAKDQRQAYDFFSNIKVNSDYLLAPHLSQTTNRINNNTDKLLLAIQDSCYLNFSTHKAKTDIGRIGKTGNSEQYGIIQHSTLCTTLNNEPLGLIDLRLYDNEKFMNKHRDK